MMLSRVDIYNDDDITHSWMHVWCDYEISRFESRKVALLAKEQMVFEGF